MPSQTPKIPPHFIVFVPGILGSKLQHKQTKEVLWVDFSSIPWNPFQWKGWIEYILSNLKYPNDQLEPAGILDEVIFVPPWAKQEHYGRMFQALEKMGYKTNPEVCSEAELDVYPFAYDWRQDNRLSARQLGQAIERWRGFHPDKQVWIIAHSMGGMVSRWYIEKLGGKEHVGRLFLMGSPRDGAPKAMNLLFSGFDTLFRRRFNLFNIGVLTRDLVRTFPSAYQLLPYEDPFLRDENNQSVDLYTALEWLENDQQREMLLDGRKFNQDLGKTLSVETICFFGTKKTTTTAGLVQFMAQGRWRDIRWDMTGAGDGTVPERSAVHPNAREKYPLHVGHGDIYINPGVLEKLEWELYRKYNLGVLAAVKTDRLDIRFDPDKDLYSPGETIQLEAEVRLIENNAPVPGARIEVQLLWRQALPGAQVTPPQALPAVQLSGSPDKTGVYTGVLTAPNIEGYYQLQAKVEAPAEPAVLLEELILVEAEPTALEGGAGGAGELPVKPEQPTPSSAAGMDDVDLELLLIQRERETRQWDQPRIRVRAGTLSGEPTASHIDAPAAAPSEPKPRCLSALLENHPMDRSLRLGELYTLSFLVDMEENPLVTQAVKAGRFPNDLVFQEGVQTVDLDVYLTGKDFRVLTKERQVLRVPRTGPSRDRAYFKIEPQQEGFAFSAMTSTHVLSPYSSGLNKSLLNQSPKRGAQPLRVWG